MPLKRKEYDLDRRTITIGKKTIDTNLRIIAHIINEVKRGFSPLILIVGERGMGKSFTACWLAYTLMICLNKTFSIKNNCVYTLEEAIEFIFREKKEVLVLDEMIEMGFRREWQKKSHHSFYKVLVTQRIRQHVYLMILPMASDLDKLYAKNVSFVIYMKKRGLMRIYQVPRNFTSFAVPDLENKRPFETIGLNMQDVPKPVWKKYQKYSKEAKARIQENIKANVIGPSILKSNADKIIDMLESGISG